MVLSIAAALERRLNTRLGETEWAGPIAGKIRPGHTVRVLNLSSSGALIETTRRLAPGGAAELHLESVEGRHVTRAAVVRCYVSGVLPDGLMFRSGLAFECRVPWLIEAEEERG